MATSIERTTWSTRISRLLKGVGAALALLSLISGVRSLSALWFEYRDESAALGSSLEAAGLMAETQEFELAWAQLDRASDAVSEPDLLPYRVAVAMQWVQWLGGVSTIEVDYKAPVERVLPYLYRGLANPGDVPPADLQALIAWAIYLGGLDEAKSMEDAVAILREAVGQDDDNLYVRTLLGFFASFDGYESYDTVVSHFDAAPAAHADAWAAGLQLSAFGNLFGDRFRRAKDDDAFLAIARRALPLAALFPEDDEFSAELTYWFSSLGRSDNVGVVEELLDVVGPDEFLAILDSAYRRRSVSYVARYLYARLEERRGDLEAARAHLSHFDESWARSATPALLALVQDAQTRLALPVIDKPDSGRNYISDERPPDVEPWRFHLDSLLNASFMFRGDNLMDAAYYFEGLPPDEVTPEIRAGIAAARNRLKDYVDEGERWLLETGGSEETESDLYVPRMNLNIVWYLAGRVAEKEGDLDRAITEWTDVKPRLLDFVTVDIELARAHAARADRDPALRRRDIDSAVSYLNEYVGRLRDASEPVPWEDIRDEPAFAALEDDAGYQALMRGRL